MSSELKRGDIVRNGYQLPPYDMYLIVGSTTRKTGMYSRTKYYEVQHIIDGELLDGKALFSKTDNKLTAIGHLSIKEVMREAIAEAIK